MIVTRCRSSYDDADDERPDSAGEHARSADARGNENGARDHPRRIREDAGDGNREYASARAPGSHDHGDVREFLRDAAIRPLP